MMIRCSQAATILHVHANTVRNWGISGKLTSRPIRPGGEVRYDLEQVCAVADHIYYRPECKSCGRVTTRFEAFTRTFNTGRCGCGGTLKGVTPI